MIDEKKLIKELRGQIFSAEVYNDDFDGTVIENLLCLGDVTMAIMKQLDEQPKISLENKTSDNLYSSCSGQVWIPVSERLPEKLQRVLVQKVSGTIEVLLYYGEKNTWGGDTYHNVHPRLIKAWMPLPKAYEE